jgi:N-sulfoglucosamine sulfohydrolase
MAEALTSLKSRLDLLMSIKRFIFRASLVLTCCLTQFLAQAADKPNVILFIGDDISWNDYGCYGNSAARTPNIDELARNGLKFNNAYLTASSCSPSRSSIITGRYPHNNGKAAELHLPIAYNLPWFPAELRKAGYFTALSGKNHMVSSRAPKGKEGQPTAFDIVNGGRIPGNSGGHGQWVSTLKTRKEGKPFFLWFASYDAHRGWDADKQWNEEKYGVAHKPKDVVVPPFLVDDTETRKDLASYYNEVTRFDYYIGQVVNELKETGELQNTLILVMADNGRPFPRAKTRLHDSGMKTALVAHWPKAIKNPGSECNGLVSAIDLAPTILQAAGVKVPVTMQGVDISPMFADSKKSVRQYAFSEHNWHDYEAHGRSVRDSSGHIFIRNFRPYSAWQGPADSVRSPSHKSLQARRDNNKLSAAQSDVFLAPRPALEFYQADKDTHQLTNKVGDKNLKSKQKELDKVLYDWMAQTKDSVPKEISKDFFDRETGANLKNKDYRGTTPGEDKGATTTNSSGPR